MRIQMLVRISAFVVENLPAFRQSVQTDAASVSLNGEQALPSTSFLMNDSLSIVRFQILGTLFPVWEVPSSIIDLRADYPVSFSGSSSDSTRVYPKVSGLTAWSENCTPLVFILLLVVYFVMTQSGNFWIHHRK